MNRRSTFYACLSALLIMAAGIFCSESALAQCSCDAGIVKVDAAVGCNVTLCFKSTNLFYCDTFYPGQTGSFRCEFPQDIYIKDCYGNLIPVTTQCTPNVVIANFCCVIACLEYSGGCPIVTIKPSPILHCICR